MSILQGILCPDWTGLDSYSGPSAGLDWIRVSGSWIRTGLDRFNSTHSIRRRRMGAEGAKPESNKRWKTGSGHVYLFLCMYVCMFFFEDISRSRAVSESKVVSCCSPVNSTLHRHDIMRFLTSARHVKRLLPRRFLQENACEFQQQHTFSSEDRRNGILK